MPVFFLFLRHRPSGTVAHGGGGGGFELETNNKIYNKLDEKEPEKQYKKRQAIGGGAFVQGLQNFVENILYLVTKQQRNIILNTYTPTVADPGFNFGGGRPIQILNFLVIAYK